MSTWARIDRLDGRRLTGRSIPRSWVAATHRLQLPGTMLHGPPARTVRVLCPLFWRRPIKDGGERPLVDGASRHIVRWEREALGRS